MAFDTPVLRLTKWTGSPGFCILKAGDPATRMARFCLELVRTITEALLLPIGSYWYGQVYAF